MELRDVRDADLPAILDIYNEIISTSTAIYAEAPTSLYELTARLKARREQGYPVLVAAAGDEVLAFASFGDFRAWHAIGIRWSILCTSDPTSAVEGLGVGFWSLS